MPTKRESLSSIARSKRHLSGAIQRHALPNLMMLKSPKPVLKKNDPAIDFVTDACATVAVAYHRAAGVYTTDKGMQELGTAAVHVLTMASSYIRAHRSEGTYK